MGVMSGKARLSINGVFVCEVESITFTPDKPAPAILVEEGCSATATIRDEDLALWEALFADAPTVLLN